MKNYKIAVAGTGYVGLSLSVLLAQHNQVMAVDIVQAKVDMINNHKYSYRRYALRNFYRIELFPLTRQNFQSLVHLMVGSDSIQ